MKRMYYILMLLIIFLAIPVQPVQAKGKRGAAAYEEFTEPWRSRFVETWERAIEHKRNEIKHLSKSLRRPNSSHLTQLYLKSAKKDMVRLKKNNPPYFGEIPVNGFAVGVYGIPYHIRARVIQVVDSNQMIVGVKDTRTAVIGYPIWIMFKYPTAGITDGARLRIWDQFEANPIIVTGTRTYKTASGGTKTLFVVEVLNLNSLKKKP